MINSWLKDSWVSLIGALYALSGGPSLYYRLAQDESFPYSPLLFAIGAVAVNFGYVFIVATVFTGTFGVFGIQGRGKLLGCSLIAILVGLVLSNPQLFSGSP